MKGCRIKTRQRPKRQLSDGGTELSYEMLNVMNAQIHSQLRTVYVCTHLSQQILQVRLSLCASWALSALLRTYIERGGMR